MKASRKLLLAKKNYHNFDRLIQWHKISIGYIYNYRDVITVSAHVIYNHDDQLKLHQSPMALVTKSIK